MDTRELADEALLAQEWEVWGGWEGEGAEEGDLSAAVAVLAVGRARPVREACVAAQRRYSRCGVRATRTAGTAAGLVDCACAQRARPSSLKSPQTPALCANLPRAISSMFGERGQQLRGSSHAPGRLDQRANWSWRIHCNRYRL